jgi:chromosome partitioning protein
LYRHQPKGLIMAEIYAITNQKGGVGKTTTSINLAASLALKKRRVLLIDADPQGNTTTGSGINKNSLEYGLHDILLKEQDIQNVILKTAHHYDLIPTNSDLTAAEIKLVQNNQAPNLLKELLHPIQTHYDDIIIDCPPALNALTLNTLVAATQLIIPMQCEYFALEGLASLISTMQQVQQHLNPKLKLLGILRTMYDPRNRLATEVSKQIQSYFPKQVFSISIPKNIKLAEAPSHGLPALSYAKYSAGAKAYMVLAEEITATVELPA